MTANLKPAISLVSIALLTMALVACGDDPPPTPTATAAPVALAPTATAEPTATAAPTATPTATPTPAATATPDPTATATPTPTAVPRATATPTATPTPTPTATATASPTATPTATATPTPTPTPEPVATAVPTLNADGTLVFDPLVVRGTLSNGLTYYIRHNEEPRDRGQLSLVLRAGSVLEDEDQRGLAHLVEHMAFNGTERFAKQEIIEYLESIGSTFGPDLNAQTGYDHTLYWLEIPTDDPEILETAFQILSDWAYAISFAPEEVELERDVVLEEWRLSQGFNSRIWDALTRAMFGASRYTDRDPIGLTEVVETAPVQRLRDYYERWYRPNLMAVVAVGDFDTELIESKVRQHFAPPPEGEASQASAAVAPPTERPRFDIPDHDDPRVVVFTDPEAPGTQINLYLKRTPDTGQDLPAFRRMVAERLAFMMINARLTERAQAADPPYIVGQAARSSWIQPLAHVTFVAWVQQGGVERGFGALLEEMQRAAQHGFTNGELSREKDNLLSAIESAYKQRDQRMSTNLAQEYADHFLDGTPVPGIEAEWALYQEWLPQISLAEVAEVSASWDQTANTVLLIMRPDVPGAILDDELSALVRTQLETASALQVDAYEDEFEDVPLLATVPTAGSITAEEQIESIDAVKWTLSNGITVVAKQTDFRNDEVVFGAFSPGGHSLVADADHVSAQYAAALVGGSGAGPHDNVTLEKLLAGKQVSVAPYIGELFEGFNGNASPEDLETLFQLVTLYATEPRLDPVFFERYQSALRSNAETRSTQPDAVFADAFFTVLSQGHLRGRRLTLEWLEELTAERAEAVYADRFADLGDSTFVVVGAFDWDNLRSLATTYLASLPTTGRVEQWRDAGIDPPAELVDQVVRSGIEPRSRTVLAYAGDMEWSREEALKITVVGEVLQTRLRERIREQLGGTYSIGVLAQSMPLPDPEYLVYILFGSDPGRAQELSDEVMAELEWLRAGGEQTYLDTAKELLRTPRQEQLRDNRFWLNQIETVMRRGESFDEINRFEERLDALTLEQIAEAARRYLPEDRYVRVVLLPEEES